MYIVGTLMFGHFLMHGINGAIIMKIVDRMSNNLSLERVWAVQFVLCCLGFALEAFATNFAMFCVGFMISSFGIPHLEAGVVFAYRM